MAKFSEMSPVTQILIFLVGGLAITAALYYGVDRQVMDTNLKLQQDLAAKKAENAQLRAYEPKLAQLNQQIANLQQQLEIEKKIVPENKDADAFMHLIQDNATNAGIMVRDFEAQPINDKGFYSEMPFVLQLDGTFYSVLNFFQSMSTSERIVNVSNLQMADIKSPSDAKARKGGYDFGPGESVVATCTATTFFSHERAAAPAKGVRPGPGGR